MAMSLRGTSRRPKSSPRLPDPFRRAAMSGTPARPTHNPTRPAMVTGSPSTLPVTPVAIAANRPPATRPTARPATASPSPHDGATTSDAAAGSGSLTPPSLVEADDRSDGSGSDGDGWLPGDGGKALVLEHPAHGRPEGGRVSLAQPHAVLDDGAGVDEPHGAAGVVVGELGRDRSPASRMRAGAVVIHAHKRYRATSENPWMPKPSRTGVRPGLTYDRVMAQQPPNPRPGRPGGQGGQQGQAPDQSWRWVILVLFGLVVAALLVPSIFKGPSRNQMTYGDFFKKVQAGQVKQATVNNDTGHVTGTLSDEKATHFTVSGPHPLPDSDVAVLKDKVSDLEFSNNQPNLLGSLLPFLLPLRVFVGFWLWMSRRAQGQMTGLMSIGRSKEKVYTTERPRTTFADVAGYGAVKQEIREVVDFLKSPGSPV